MQIERIGTYTVNGYMETSRNHKVMFMECGCGHKFQRRPLRLWGRGWTRCPKCRVKLIRSHKAEGL